MCPAACPPVHRVKKKKKRPKGPMRLGIKWKLTKGEIFKVTHLFKDALKDLFRRGFTVYFQPADKTGIKTISEVFQMFFFSSVLFFSGSDVGKEMLDKVERCFLNRYAVQERSQNQYR